MATKLPLFQRTETGAVRPGEVKPRVTPVSTEPSKFTGEVFDEIYKTRVVNEEAAFQSGTKGIMEEYQTFVSANPGASFEDLEKQRDKAMVEIGKLSQTATTPEARERNAQRLKLNRRTLLAQTQTQMEEIQSKQQQLAAEANIKRLVSSMDEEGLDEFYYGEDGKGGVVGSKLYNKDVIDARFAQQKQVMDEARRELAVGNATGIGFDVWEATGDTKLALDAIDKLPIPEGDKQEVESEMLARIGYREIQDKAVLQNRLGEQDEAIQDSIDGSDYAAANLLIDTFDTSTLKGEGKAAVVDWKQQWDSKIKAAQDATSRGELNNFQVDDGSAYGDLLERATQVPGSVTETELDELHGKGPDGLSTAHFKELSSLIQPDSIRSNDAHYVRVTSVLSGMRKSGFWSDTGPKATPQSKLKNDGKWLEFQTKYDRWFDDIVEKQNRVPTTKETSEWQNSVLSPEVKTKWWELLFTQPDRPSRLGLGIEARKVDEDVVPDAQDKGLESIPKAPRVPLPPAPKSVKEFNETLKRLSTTDLETAKEYAKRYGGS